VAKTTAVHHTPKPFLRTSSCSGAANRGGSSKMEKPLKISDPPASTIPTFPKPLYVTVATAKKITDLGNTKLYELIGSRVLQSIKVGKRRLIVYSSLEDLKSRGNAA
jgi:hypothetical protein